MITKLDSIKDIATEFGTTLTGKTMSWFYNNRNLASPHQPTPMGGGNIKSWIGYDHSYSPVKLSVTPTKITCNYGGIYLFKFVVTSGNIPTLTKYVSWISDFRLDSQIETTYNYEGRIYPNNEEFLRRSLIDITNGKESTILEIEQSGKPAIFSIDPTSMVYGPLGGDSSIKIYGGEGVTVQSPNYWIVIKNYDDDKCYYHVNEIGLDAGPRTGEINVTSNGETLKHTITQYKS